jgi:hypothetical protein
MDKFRKSNIEQIEMVTNIFGEPSHNFESMSDIEVATVWMGMYESYPEFFEV